MSFISMAERGFTSRGSLISTAGASEGGAEDEAAELGSLHSKEMLNREHNACSKDKF